VAVERLAGKAVLGEAPEDLDFTLEDLERVRKFLATTRREYPSERGAESAWSAGSRRSQDRLALSRGLFGTILAVGATRGRRRARASAST